MADKSVMRYLKQQNRVRAVSERFDIPPLQLECILFIGANSGGESNWTMDSDVLFDYLEKQAGYKYTNISMATGKLHRRDLIDKDIHPVNQRKRILKLTSSGFEVYRAVKAQLD